MVFFTCNHCGESVKKPSVDKHYNTKCRGAPKSISCMDCQKDFQDNYVEHTKCITELEKYSGKDYVPRESANSGAKKQETWVETVRAVLDSSDYKMSAPARQAFITLQKFDNVPRKKAKFLNFVTNSVHIPRKTVEEVWNILDKEQEKIKQARQKELAAAKKPEKSVKETKDNDSGEPKNKKQKLTQNGHDAVEKVEDNDTNEAKLSKKEKKLKKQQANGDASNDLTEDKETADKSAKKQKKQQAAETEEATESEEQSTLKKKKKKAKDADNSNDTEEHATEEQPKENGKVDSKKKQKKRANEESIEATSVSPKKSKLNGIKENDDKVANGATADADDYAFCWDYEFQNIMGKNAEGILIEKLKKKILKKYKTKFDAELTEKQLHGFEKKFNKKMKKNSLLKIEDDIVKPVES